MAYTVLKPFTFVQGGKVVSYNRYGTEIEELPAKVSKELLEQGKIAESKKAPEPPAVAESTPAVKPYEKADAAK